MQTITNDDLTNLIKHINCNMEKYDKDIDFKIKRSDRIELSCMKVSELEELRLKELRLKDEKKRDIRSKN